MKTLHLAIIIILFVAGTGLVFAQSNNTQIQNGVPSTNSTCTDNIIQNIKTKYASFDEERAKTEAVNYDAFKSEVKNDKYIFRAVSQEWANDQVKCDVTFKTVLVLFVVTNSSGKDRDVTVLINPESYKPQGIDVKYDVPTHGGIITEKIPSPLKQLESGINPADIKCNNGLSLVVKAEDNSPACVKPDTAQKLTEGGWALTRLTINGLKEIYGVGEKIDFMIDFQGLLHYCDYPHVSVLDSNQNIVWKSQDVNSMCVSAPFSPLPYVNQNFDLNSGYGGPIMINKTGNYTVKVSLYGNSVEKGFIVK